MNNQLSLDTLIEKRKALPDGWQGNAYRCYGSLYGLRVIGFDKSVHTPGRDYSVVHGIIKENEVKEE
jgi:hypothetical protein